MKGSVPGSPRDPRNVVMDTEMNDMGCLSDNWDNERKAKG